MSILQDLWQFRQNAKELQNALTYKDIWESGGDVPNSGVGVGSEQALRVSAVMACVRILAESIASLPLFLYRRTEKNGVKGKERASDLPLYHLLHDKPNEIQTSFNWREMLEAHLALNGNALSQVVRSGTEITEIIPLKPQFTTEVREDVLLYRVTHQDGKPGLYSRRELLHVPGLTLNGVEGLSPIAYARQAIGLAGDAENYGADNFNTGATQRVALELPPGEKIDKTERDLLRQSFDKKYAGNSETAILTGGMKASVIGMSAKDAQFLETRKFQNEDIARIYRIPPHMIGELSRSTNNNITEQARSFVDNTLRPWLVRWEQAMNRDLLRNSKKFYIEFCVEGLLRGDIDARTNYYVNALGNTNNGQKGWLTPQEIRITENLNPVPAIGTLTTGMENNNGTNDTDEQEA